MPDSWARPPGVFAEEVDRATGGLVSSDCPPRGPTYTEYFVGSPPRGFCPREYYAWDDRGIWGDEEWGPYLDTLEDRGIIWPELEELRARRNDADTMADLDPERLEPGTRVDTIIPPIREGDLPGVPVRRDTAENGEEEDDNTSEDDGDAEENEADDGDRR